MSKQFQFFLIFLILLALVKKKFCCTNDLFCYICPYNSYDPNYYSNLRISLNQGKDLNLADCIPKNVALISKRTIVILNNATCDECVSMNFDMIYNSLPQAFQQESRIAVTYLYTNLVIYLQKGNHYVIKNSFPYYNIELFRRTLINITIQPFPYNIVNVFMKTSTFYIFISGLFLIENINFYGNDINLNETNSCASENYTCCAESDLSHLYDPSLPNSDCSVIGQNVQDNNLLTDYGLFNLEYVFDNPILSDFPHLIINNCLFRNFYIINNRDRFGSIIMLTTYPGIVEMNNMTLTHSYFIQSFIYYLDSNYDLVLIIQKKLIVNQTFIDNIYSLNSTILIYNSNISFLNFLSNENPEQLDNFLTIMNLNGTLSVENSTFGFITEIPVILKISNQNYMGSFFIRHSTFINITNTSLIYEMSLVNSEISQVYIQYCFNQKAEFIQINNNLMGPLFDRIQILDGQTNLTIPMIIIVIIAKSSSVVQNSFFSRNIAESMISQAGNNFLIQNCTFRNIVFSDAIIIFKNGHNHNLTNSSFENLVGKMSLFYSSNANFIYMQSIYIKNASCYSVFFLDQINQNLVQDFILTKSVMTIVWSADQTCKNTTFHFGFITNSTFTLIFQDFYISQIKLLFNTVFIHQNNFTSIGMLRFLNGYVTFNKLNLRNNFFLNSQLFQMVLNFAKACSAIITNSYFESTGVSSHKTYYVGTTENCFVSVGLGVAYSTYDNLTMVATDKVEMVSGFFSGDSYGGLFTLTNSRLIILSTNPAFGYKGLYMSGFLDAYIVNNSFYNMMCSTLSKSHMHGGVFFGTSSSYIYSKNTITLEFWNNSFYNCSCYYGGSLAVIGLSTVSIMNCTFYGSTASRFGGHMVLIAGQQFSLKNLVFNSSSAQDVGGGMVFLNIFNISFTNISINNAFSVKNGAIFCRLVLHLSFKDVISNNTYSQQNGGFLYLMNGIAYLNNISITFSYSSLYGGSVYTDGSSTLYIRNSLINESESSYGGAFNIENSQIIEIMNCSIYSSTATKKAAAILVNSVKSFLISLVFIVNNKNLNGNGVLFFQNDDETASIKLKNITCLRNYALMGSCIYYFSSTPVIMENITIIDCQLYPIFTLWSYMIPINISGLLCENISSSGNLINVAYGDITFTNFKFFNNNLTEDLILCSQTSGTIINIFFGNNSISKAFSFIECNIFISTYSIINDKNYKNKLGFFTSSLSFLNFSMGIVQYSFDYSNTIVYFIDGNLTLKDTQIFNSVGQVLVIETSNLFVRDCAFLNNSNLDQSKSNDIDMRNTENTLYKCSLINSKFDLISHFSLNFQGTINISIKNSSFKSFNFISSEQIFSIYAFNFLEISIENSSFSDLSDSAIKLFTDKYSLISISIITITNTQFTRNKALLGSSVYIYATAEIFFQNSSFSQNTAYISDQTFNLLEGIAPAVFFQPLTLINSKISFFSCIFEHNIAEYLAPTVFSQMEIVLDNSNIFKNNTYLSPINFTSKFFAFPINIKPISYQNSENNIIFNESSGDFTVNTASGETTNITVQIIDYFGHALSFDDSTILMIKSNTQKNDTNSIFVESNIGVSKSGNIEFKNVIIKTLQTGFFTLLIQGALAKITQDPNNQLNPFVIEYVISFKTRSCVKGEITLNDSSCSRCHENTYSLMDPTMIQIKYQRCIPCPQNSYCLGGNFITPLSGYYRKNNESNNVVPCTNPASCDGYILNFNLSDPTLINGMCNFGNYGPLCFYCDQKYGKYQNGDPCSGCDVIVALIYLRLVLTLAFIFVNLIINAANVEKYSRKKDSDIFNVISKIIINHSQHIMLIIRNSLSLPDFTVFKNLFNICDYFSFINIGSFTNECFVNTYYYAPKEMVVYLSLVSALAPFCFALGAFLFWLLIIVFAVLIVKSAYFREELKNLKHKIFSKYILFLLLCAYMFYPMILKSSFTLMDCLKLDQNDSTTYLRESPDIQCWSKEHLQNLIAYGLPGLILWGVTFPCFLLVLLHNAKKNNKINKKQVNLNKKSTPLPLVEHTDSYEIKNKIFMSSENKKTTPCPENISSLEIKKDFDYMKKDKVIMSKNNKKATPVYFDKNFSSEDFKKPFESKKVTSAVNFDQNEMAHANGHGLGSSHDKFENKQSVGDKQSVASLVEGKSKNVSILNFFYGGYQSKYYYWESLIFFRKFFLALILTLDQTINQEFKWILVIIILLIYFNITVACQPYKRQFANKLELFSLFTCIISVFISSLAESNENSSFTSVFNIICIIANLTFYAAAFIFILFNFLLKMKGKIIQFKKYAVLHVSKWMSLKMGKTKLSVGIAFNQKKKSTMKTKKVIKMENEQTNEVLQNK